LSSLFYQKHGFGTSKQRIIMFRPTGSCFSLHLGYALAVSSGAGVFDVSSHRAMRNNANVMCVIPADDAAKEDLEGQRVAERLLKNRMD
jgi:hypothetical protein